MTDVEHAFTFIATAMLTDITHPDGTRYLVEPSVAVIRGEQAVFSPNGRRLGIYNSSGALRLVYGCDGDAYRPERPRPEDGQPT